MFRRVAAILATIFVSIHFIFGSSTGTSHILDDSVLSCSGNLGENIFVNGDFGSGTANIPSANPQIAPGYNYTTAPPPNDGYYTITNSTENWGNLWPSWMRTGDNSNDPNGYFMVVNASYDPGLFYSQEVRNLCTNTQYEFSIDVLNLIRRNVTNHILPDVDMLLNNQVVLQTGPIPQDETWKTYKVSFCTGPTDTVMTLSIRNNAPGGIGNDLGLDNISFRPCGPVAEITPTDTSYVCLTPDADPVVLNASVTDPAFQAFQWQWSQDGGQTWDNLPSTDASVTITSFAAGAYLYRYLLATSPDNITNSKCRIISEVKTLIAVPIYYDINDTICEGTTYQVGTSVYTRSGVYEDSLISSIGCDSIVTTTLTVVDNPPTSPLVDVIPPSCFGDGDAEIITLDVPEARPPLIYSLDNGPSANSGLFTGLTSGNYLLTVTDRMGCTFSANIGINDPAEYVLNILPDSVISLSFGEGTALEAITNQNAASFIWTPDSGLTCGDCPNPFAIPFETTRYKVFSLNDQGCPASDSILIQVEKADFPVYIPTGFTPNDDGINDAFTIIAKSPGGIRSVQHFSVFNRWGKIVYRQESVSGGTSIVSWDGWGKGSPSPEGVYAFVLKLQLIDNSIQTYSGSITLIR